MDTNQGSPRTIILDLLALATTALPTPKASSVSVSLPSAVLDCRTRGRYPDC